MKSKNTILVHNMYLISQVFNFTRLENHKLKDLQTKLPTKFRKFKSQLRILESQNFTLFVIFAS